MCVHVYGFLLMMLHFQYVWLFGFSELFKKEEKKNSQGNFFLQAHTSQFT